VKLTESRMGGGRDIDGSYDSGYTTTEFKCTLCFMTNTRNGFIAELIKRKVTFPIRFEDS